jgi:hypothetical protein
MCSWTQRDLRAAVEMCAVRRGDDGVVAVAGEGHHDGTLAKPS